MDFDPLEYRLLIANRGEIAVRILKTAKRLGIPTIAIYSQADALALHVVLADDAVPLCPEDAGPASNAKAYLDIAAILQICKDKRITFVHPGYGFLSENAEFATRLAEEGITLLGPSAEVIREMGLKHEARRLSTKAQVPVVPGSDGLLHSVEQAVEMAERIGFPVMLKSTAGGGGMGLVICNDLDELRTKFISTQERAKVLFQNDGVFIEKYFSASRHIEIQVFGNGMGHTIHMGERECSVQRRHQKVIEETPSPFLERYPGIRNQMCAAAVRLCKLINYKSAGTCEFLVDEERGEFYFLEMNTRLQVEHPITEAVSPGLDLVELMILQGIAERSSHDLTGGLDTSLLDQSRYATTSSLHAIEARVYCENPAAQFRPCPGLLQHVKFLQAEWLRVDSWIETGTTITPHFDPLACKLVATGSTREEALSRLSVALYETRILGPPNNMEYLQAICESKTFRDGNATTTFLDTFSFVPRAMGIISGGIETTIQDYPGRLVGFGIPRSGPMDSLAFQAANALVDNSLGTEGLEIVLPGGMSGPRLHFYVPTVVAVTGSIDSLTLDGKYVRPWSRVLVPAGGNLTIGGRSSYTGSAQGATGFRAYLAVRGGFPDVPEYLGSKSTSMGFGGYQGRSLVAGDQLALGDCEPEEGEEPFQLPSPLIPTYPSTWTVYTLSGPHDDPGFVTPEGIEAFYATEWTISISSNRMGIRLEAGPGQPAAAGIEWSRNNGGEGGSHPSNIHDSGYAYGSINLNGDTPVVLTNEGPSMGGYICISTVASADLWKLGQLVPGSKVRLMRISYDGARNLHAHMTKWIDTVIAIASGFNAPLFSPLSYQPHDVNESRPILLTIAGSDRRPRVGFRQAGDAAILVEYGEMLLDFGVRARIHAFEEKAKKLEVKGVRSFAPCIRSTMCHYDPSEISQTELLHILAEVDQSLPSTVDDMVFPGRKVTFPIVLDDKWNREALMRYMHTTRDKAVYLPSNIQYLADNNGLAGAKEALQLLVSSSWLVLGVGFYLGCPFLVPIDPRCRLVGQKMNPSRTYTPRGAIGIAGLVAGIYPVESPGGYQLYGRTLPAWQTWGKGPDFDPESPWLLQPFDQVIFEPVPEDEYVKIEKTFDSGRYAFKIEQATFSMREYTAFVDSISEETAIFKDRQQRSVAREELREEQLLKEWQKSKLESKSHSATFEDDDDDPPGLSYVTSSLSGIVWKLKVKPGDVISSPESVVAVLEAMKTEVNVEAGEDNVGRVVRGFGKGIQEGNPVAAGDILVILQ